MSMFSVALFGYFLLLPFQFALSPTEGIDLAIIRLLTIGLVGVFLVRGLLQKKILLPPLLPVFFLTGLLLMAVGSFLWADNPSFALRKSLFWLSFFPLFFVLASWFRECPGDRANVVKFFVGGAFVSAMGALLIFVSQFFFGVGRVFSFLTDSLLPFFLGATFAQSVALHPSLLVNLSGETVLRASGVFPDPHMFAFYLGLAAPLALAISLAARSAKEKTFWQVVFAGILLADLLSFSRGGYVGLFFGGALFLFSSGWLHHLPLRKKVLWFILLLFCGAALLMSPVGTRLLSSFSSQDTSNTERLRLWQEALVHIGERPLLGTGLGNYPLLVQPSASYRDPIYAHNMYLDIALEVGIVGLVFFLGVLGYALLTAFRHWAKNREWLALGVVSSLMVFLTHSFFDTALFSVHALPALLLLMAVGVSYRYEKTFS